jgi:transglutaminase-like putative cysteine protease
MAATNDQQHYLQSTEFANAAHPDIVAFVSKHIALQERQTAQAIQLYEVIRDGFWYNPHKISLQRQDYVASNFLHRTAGHCIDKANLLVACARVLAIPSRMGFANVTNHIATENIEKVLGTKVLVFHGYAELFLEGKWVKATPAFNKALCEKLGVQVLAFDGKTDSIFQQFTSSGTQFMEYLQDYGTFADIPFEMMIAEWKKYYPNIFAKEIAMIEL